MLHYLSCFSTVTEANNIHVIMSESLFCGSQNPLVMWTREENVVKELLLKKSAILEYIFECHNLL